MCLIDYWSRNSGILFLLHGIKLVIDFVLQLGCNFLVDHFPETLFNFTEVFPLGGQVGFNIS